MPCKKRLWSRHDIKLATKIKVYNTAVLPSMLYSTECMILYRRHIKKLTRIQMRHLRQLLGVKWEDRVPDVPWKEQTPLALKPLSQLHNLGGPATSEECQKHVCQGNILWRAGQWEEKTGWTEAALQRCAETTHEKLALITIPGKKQLLIGQDGAPLCELQKHQQNRGEETPMKPDITHNIKDLSWHR